MKRKIVFLVIATAFITGTIMISATEGVAASGDSKSSEKTVSDKSIFQELNDGFLVWCKAEPGEKKPFFAVFQASSDSIKVGAPKAKPLSLRENKEELARRKAGK